jgi:hypothetical protein
MKKREEKLTPIRQMFEEHDYMGGGCVLRLRYSRKYIYGYYIWDRISLAQVREDLPEGWYAYAIRESDRKWDTPATLENNRVCVNFWGYFITKTNIDFKNSDFVNISDFGYL